MRNIYDYTLKELEDYFLSVNNREYVLNRYIQQVKDDYDYILINGDPYIIIIGDKPYPTLIILPNKDLFLLETIS